MDNAMYLKFLTIWNNTMVIGAIILVIASFLVFIYHKIRIGSIKDLKQKIPAPDEPKFSFTIILSRIKLSVSKQEIPPPRELSPL